VKYRRTRPNQSLSRFAPLIGALLSVTMAEAQTPLPLEETTIADVHSAIEDGRLTCRELVDFYLARIAAYDRRGPAINAIVRVNPNAQARAEELDAQFRRSGLTGPMHCIPVIVKENYDTIGMPTTAGSLSLQNSQPPDDAFQVRRIREAGALVLAKSNMAEFAFSPYETLSSILPGHTRNPYALHRVPAGSSGGTAAAVAANFGLIGLGTDTGNSIRGPSSHNSLVGIRSTMGLTSRDGIVPLNLRRDIGGPMGRTVEDVVRVFDVIAGSDPNDSVTADADSRRPSTFLNALDPNGLEGARIAVVRQLIDNSADAEVVALFNQALNDMRRKGAIIIDPVEIADYDANVAPYWTCNHLKFELEEYLASLGEHAPMKTLAAIIESRQFHPSIEKRLSDAQATELPPRENPACAEVARLSANLRENIQRVFAEHELDALAYPTWNNPPRLQGDLNTPHGNNSPRLSPPTGLPAITVPMGFAYDRFPAGLQLLGADFSEAVLFRLAYAYEQATHHRRPPASTPPIAR